VSTPAAGASSSSSSTSRAPTTASRPCVEEGEHLDAGFPVGVGEVERSGPEREKGPPPRR
jgi:hypothetical protein